MEDLIVRCPRCRIEYSMPVKAVGIAEKLGVSCSCGERIFVAAQTGTASSEEDNSKA